MMMMNGYDGMMIYGLVVDIDVFNNLDVGEGGLL